MTRNVNRRAGFSLVECLIVLFVLAVSLAIGTALIATTIQTQRLGDTAANRISQRTQLTTQFRSDVARARAALERTGRWVAGPECLILELAENKRVVYHWQNNALLRIEQFGERESQRVLTSGPAGTALAFVQTRGRDKLVTLRITESEHLASPRTMEVSAALGGDRR